MKLSDKYILIEKAIHFLSENHHNAIDLNDLSKYLGISPSSCQREFKKWVGISPKDYLQAITFIDCKNKILEARSIFDTALELDISSPSRIHDLFIKFEAMTPGQFKHGAYNVTINYGTFDSPFGLTVIAVTPKGICYLAFIDDGSEVNIINDLLKKWPNSILQKMNKAKLSEYEKLITNKILGKKTSSISLDVKGTQFQIKVWQALLEIDESKISTYADIASFIGSPDAQRAVGSAIGKNPIAFLIPCHRVIKSSGHIGQYHWDALRKKMILSYEISKKSMSSSYVKNY